MVRIGFWSCLLVMILAAAFPAAAQSCSAEATQALTQVGTNCAALGDNATCYGHQGVNASFTEPVAFTAPGNIAPLPPLTTISTLPYNAATGEWGIALLRLQAGLPGTLPGQSATLMLMGDVQVNAAPGTGAPMQAFNLRVGVGQPQCQGLPPSTITVNSPQRGALELTVNGASMRLGSNVTIRATETGKLRFLVTAGRLQIENGPIVPVGFATTVEVDENGDILTDSWEDVEPITPEELEELEPLEALPDDVLGEAFPLPSEEEIALLAALDFDLLLAMDPYLAEALAEDWAANGFVPDDIFGATLDDLEAYLLDNLEFFAVDDAFLAALGDSFDLPDDALLGLADELGIEFDPASLTDDVADPDALSETEPGDSGEVLDEPPVEEAPPDEAPPVEAPPGDEGGGGEGEGGGDGGGEGG